MNGHGEGFWEWMGWVREQGRRSTFERSLYIHLLYGSSAKACWIVSIAPSMSASVIRVTSMAISGRLVLFRGS